MAKVAREQHDASIRVVCRALNISETCYRYQPRLSDENAEIADWLVRLTHNWKDGIVFVLYTTKASTAPFKCRETSLMVLLALLANSDAWRVSSAT